jgi:phenylacetate-coenzyme A ligase PaaK-like adenylate-forming protein
MTINKTLIYFKSFQEKILNVEVLDFEEMALDIFRLQATNNPVYGEYLKARKIRPSDIKQIDEIPFLPIGFFKTHPVVSGQIRLFESYYSSSGTTGMVTSKHYVWSEEFYLHHSLNLFEKEYGNIQGYHVLALLPSYLERKGSSLVSMADFLIKKSKSPHSGFYLYNHQELLEKIALLKEDSRKILLLGVTFALLDLAESGMTIQKADNLIVMETGGMKGRRREMIREEVHGILMEAFGVCSIHSEYGMTELMSQAYSKGEGKYTLAPTMRVYLRDVNDPFSPANRSQGGINIIDLANFHSCAFIETQDLGKVDTEGKVEILGRFDNSEIRGCNLLLN